MGGCWVLLGCLVMHNIRVQAAFGSDKPPDRPQSYPKFFWFEYTTAPLSPIYYDEYEVGTETPATQEPLPYFESDMATANVTAQLGDTAFLHCRVHDLNDKTVSWLRRKGDELHLLTFGLHTYSSDSRYTLLYKHPDDWTLEIKYANKRDEGLYECQVSTHPPKVLYVQLNVVVPKVVVVDDHGGSLTDKFYKAGSTIELKCVISQVPHPSSYVTWRHGERMLNYDTSRGGISVKTDIMAEGAISKLYIANANTHDSGNYTCSLADVASTSIMVHVLNENPAAMQHGTSTSNCRDKPLSTLTWLLAAGQIYAVVVLR